MKICFAVSECVPFAKTGGLADVAGALPRALQELGCNTKIFLPRYKAIDIETHGFVPTPELGTIPLHIGSSKYNFQTWHGTFPQSDVEVYLVDCPELFERRTLYTNDKDEAERFILFQHAIFQILQRYHWSPDILHCNDWQTGLMPAMLHSTYAWDSLFQQTAALFSIHNMAYQGKFLPDIMSKTGLSDSRLIDDSGSFSFMLAGLRYADALSTVSPTYAKEIQTKGYGEGLHSLLAERSDRLSGILNGIDTEVWNPATDALIPYQYSKIRLAPKEKNKKSLISEVGLNYKSAVPALGIISRFADQKGFDILLPILDRLMQLPVQMIVLGSGEKRYETVFKDIAKKYPDKMASHIGFNDTLAHKITAGCDMFLMPSHYEPCGLNQMYSLNYGTVPIVRKTGGLADTVIDYDEKYSQGNGFAFSDATPEALLATIKRALHTFEDKKSWRNIMKRGLDDDFSWHASALKYLELYQLTKLHSL